MSRRELETRIHSLDQRIEALVHERAQLIEMLMAKRVQRHNRPKRWPANKPPAWMPRSR